MQQNTSQFIVNLLKIVAWIIFIGLCVNAGGIAVNTIMALFVKGNGARNFWDGSQYLSSLFTFNKDHFLTLSIIITIVAVLKAILFYCIIKLLHEKKLDIVKPFTPSLGRFILNMAYLSTGIGLFSYGGFNYTNWLHTSGAGKADLPALHIGGADVWLFMAVVLFVIGHMVGRGIAIQQENDLTV